MCNYSLVYDKDYQKKIFDIKFDNLKSSFKMPESLKKIDNQIYLLDRNNKYTKVNSVEGCSINFKGSNNVIILGDCSNYAHCYFEMMNDCIIFIKPSFFEIHNLTIVNWKFNGQKLFIDENFSCGGCKLVLPSKDMYIGKDCMFSYGIEIWGEDGHALLDMNNKCINNEDSLYIGDHVWIGCNATITKNSYISNNNIIGTKALVSGFFKKSNCVIAGNPATVLKCGVSWHRNSPHTFL